MGESTNQQSFLSLLFSVLFKQRSEPATKQSNHFLVLSRRPAKNDRHAWIAYWKTQGQRWRTEPEISTERQKDLAERRQVKPDIEKGVYPFRGVKLTRADVEWLLATHENGRGPIEWSDESQRSRVGLDLRSTDLSNLDLSGLPLARMLGSLDEDEWRRSTLKPSEIAAVNLENAFLNEIHLEGAKLRRAHLNGAELYGAHMEEADLLLAELNEAFLFEAHLEKANLRRANLEGANLQKAHLEGANLCLASFNYKSILENVIFTDEKFGTAILADVHWTSVNLAVINWSSIKVLGDEEEAQKLINRDGKEKDRDTQIIEYQTAVRANRQLAATLKTQGLHEEADNFAYRSQVIQRQIYPLQALAHTDQQKKRFSRWFPLFIFGYVQLGLFFLGYLIFLSHNSVSQDFISSILQVIVRLELFLTCLLALIYLPPLILKLEYRPKEKRPQIPLLLFFLILGFLVLCLFPILYLPPILLPIPMFLIETGFALPVLLVLGMIFLLSRIPILKRFRISFMLLFVSLLVDLGFIGYLFQVLPNLLEEVQMYDPFLFLRLWLIPPLALIALHTLLRLFFYLRRKSSSQWSLPRLPRLISIKAALDYGRYIFSLFLDLLAGYGYKPSRSLACYLFVIFGFATAYYFFHPNWNEALIFSITSFHGRGFFPSSNISLSDPKIILAAIEAVIGLFIEISFIATFTQRFFGK